MVYVTGDIHGDITRFSEKELKLLKKQDTLIICGDFGFIWNGSKSEQRTLKQLNKSPYTIAFLDGTHENFDLLEEYPVREWNGGRVHQIMDNIVHLMRGEIYSIEEMEIFTFGGGESPDRDLRRDLSKDGEAMWWQREMPSSQEVQHSAQNLENHNLTVDFVLTHEPPSSIKHFLNLDGSQTHILNTYFDEISKTCQFKRWFFGSCHIDKPVSQRHTAIFRDVIPLNPPVKRQRRRS